MTEDEDDAYWEQAFADKFGTNRAGVDERLKAERRAGRTQGQRRNKAMPKKQINFRATPETRALLDRMVEVLGKHQTDVVAQAISEMAGRVLPKGDKK